MYTAIYNAIIEWHRAKNERQKLQHMLFVLAVLTLMLAGLVSLLNPQSGQRLLIIPTGAAIVFLVNAILWALAESLFISHLSGRRKR